MTQPRITPSEVEVAEAAKTLLPNGVALYTLASEEFEVLRISFVFRAGSALQQVPFSASAAANLLAEGTRNMTAREIAEQLDYYGSWYDVNVDRDYAYINFATLSKFFDRTLAVAEEILLRPVFPEEELRTYAAKRKQRLAIDRTKVDVEAREAFARALFGAHHPYGISSDEREYDNLTREAVADFHRRFYTAENCFVVCSGRIGEHELQAVGALAAQLPHGEAETAIRFPAPETTHAVFVEHPGAVQSSLRLGRLLFPRQHPDFVGMQVVATALGGYFGSRLMQNLREKHGYTYGVVSAMVNFEREGYFAVAAQVGTDVTQEALQEICKEIVRCGGLDGRVNIALDYFDASINRISAWTVGFRNVEKALLSALCTPHTVLKELQDTNQFTELMVRQEELKALPFGEVWDEYCRRNGVPVDGAWFEEVKKYEQNVLSKRI